MVIAALPAGPAYFPEDQITDQPARFMAAEIIREQVLLNTSEEIPYATTVIVDNFEEGAQAHADCGDHLLRARRAEGNSGGQGRPDAEKDRHLGPLADRAHAGDESLSRTLRESRTGMARFAPLRGRTRLAPATRAPDDGTRDAARKDRRRQAAQTVAATTVTRQKTDVVVW